MRTRARAAVAVAVASAFTVLLTVVSAVTAAVTLAATALIVPGTGTPNANVVAGYLDNVRDYYLQDTPCTSAANCSTTGIDYPASFFPLAFIPGWCRSGPDGCDTWDVSVDKGAAGLASDLAPFLDPSSTEDVVIFGYSQGGAVVAKVFSTLGGAPQSVKDRLQVVTIGGIENPDGGLWQRFAPLGYIPFFDVAFDPAMPTDTGIRSTAIALEYDGVTDAPKYFGNTLAVLNALAGFAVVHGFYLAPNANDPTATLPYGYTPATLREQLDCGRSPANCRYGSGGTSTYITIPATSLPLFTLLDSFVGQAFKPLTSPLIALLTPVTKVLIDLAYDRTGDPDAPTPLSLLPFDLSQDYPALAQRIVAAIGQGIEDALRPGTTVAPAPATSPTATARIVSVAAAESAPTAAPASPPTVAGHVDPDATGARATTEGDGRDTDDASIGEGGIAPGIAGEGDSDGAATGEADTEGAGKTPGGSIVRLPAGKDTDTDAGTVGKPGADDAPAVTQATAPDFAPADGSSGGGTPDGAHGADGAAAA